MYICIESYCGPSDYLLTSKCNGRLLSKEEIESNNLFPLEMRARFKKSDYEYEFFEVKPGDVITITMCNPEGILSDTITKEIVVTESFQWPKTPDDLLPH